MLPQMMPMPWLLMFFLVFYSFYSIYLLISSFYSPFLVTPKTLKTSFLNMTW